MVFRTAKVGSVGIGGSYPISIQSMLKNRLSSYSKESLDILYNAGCDIMRFSIIDESADCIRKAVLKSPFPLIADIQGSLSQALLAIEAGCAGIRINPGNFKESDLERLIEKRRDFCIRIGINEASLGEKNPLLEIEKYLNFFTSKGFDNLVVSIKSSSPERTLHLNREYAKKFDYPLHIGLTEAGEVCISAVRSTLVLSELLSSRIGSTIRYSISSAEIDEILCASELLSSLGLRKKGVRFVSCPMCSRHGIDTQSFSRQIANYIFSNFDTRKISLSIAVMGCVVNGRGEAAGADVALCALFSGDVEVYDKGALVGRFSKADALEAVKSLIEKKYSI